MALNSNKELKQYYSITEVSEMFSLPASLLRFWEKEFPTIRPKKNNNGVRIYTKADIEEIRLVYDLVKGRNKRLQSVRDQLLEIKKELEGIV